MPRIGAQKLSGKTAAPLANPSATWQAICLLTYVRTRGYATGDMPTHDKDGPLSDGGEKTGIQKDEDMIHTSIPPTFVELLPRMIEQLSDDIVSWSITGDSFIIKQASEKR